MQVQVSKIFAPFLAAALMAQSPVEDRQTLVAKYVAMVRAATETAKLPPQDRKRPSLEASPQYLSAAIAKEHRQDRREVLLMTRLFLQEALAAGLAKLPENQAIYVDTVQRCNALELSGQISPDSPALDLLAEQRFSRSLYCHRRLTQAPRTVATGT